MTVEKIEIATLTAAVHTLVVGSRQVTLSVFRQLDQVRTNEMQAFGRVNDGGGQWLVGRHSVSGDLVRALAPSIRNGKLIESRHIPSRSGNPRRMSDEEWRTFRGLPLLVLAGLK